MATYLEVSFPAVTSSVREARQAVAEIAAQMGGTDRLVDDVRLCVSEAVANAVRHAYVSELGVVDISVDRSHDELAVVVRDKGRGLPEVRHEGKLGFGLRIIERVALRYEISSEPEVGAKIQMFFALPSGSAADDIEERLHSRRSVNGSRTNRSARRAGRARPLPA